MPIKVKGYNLGTITIRQGRSDHLFPRKKTWAGACNERSSTIEYHPTPSLHFISQPYNQGESRPMVYINIHDSSYEWISILGYRIESVWRQAAKWSPPLPEITTILEVNQPWWPGVASYLQFTIPVMSRQLLVELHSQHLYYQIERYHLWNGHYTVLHNNTDVYLGFP